MPLDQDTLDILSQSAVLAGTFGLAKEAGTITAAISAVVPDDENVTIIESTTHLSAGKFDEAIALLRDKVLAKNPKNTSAKAFLALAYHMSGRPADSEKLCKEVMDANDDADAVELVKNIQEG